MEAPKGGKVYLDVEDGLLCLSGPGTFTYKSKFRDLGFKWRSDIKKWVNLDTSKSMILELQKILKGDLQDMRQQTGRPSNIRFSSDKPKQMEMYVAEQLMD